MKFYVYILIDPRNDIPFYVGKGHGYRIFHHFDAANKHPKYHVHRKIAKMSREQILPRVELCYCDDEEFAFFLEFELIKFFGRKDKNQGPLLNYTDGGEGCSGRILSEKTKRKISQIKIGKKIAPCSEERKIKLSTFHTGKKRSEEIGKRISFSLLGKKRGSLNEKHKQAISISLSGENCTSETRNLLSEKQKEVWRKRKMLKSIELI